MEPYQQNLSLEPRMRIRVQNDLIKVNQYQERTFAVACNPSWTNSGLDDVRVNGKKVTMVDFVVPRFKSRRAKGEVFFNNMNRVEITVSTNGGAYLTQSVANACQAQYPGVKVTWRNRETGRVQTWLPASAADEKGVVIPPVVYALADSSIDSAKSLASTEVLAKRGTADSDLWESLAEYRQTLQLLNLKLSTLTGLLNRVQRSVNKGRVHRDLLEKISGGYLVYRYGILPLMNDIKNLAASLNKGVGDKRVTQRAFDRINAFKTTTGIVTYSGFGSFTWSNYVQDNLSLRAMSLDQGHVSFANNLGLTTKGLILLPWQLTSYSFVADWFANFGSYLGANIPAFGWTNLGSCLQTKRTTTNLYVLGTFTNLAPTLYTHPNPGGGSIAITRVETMREPLRPAKLEIESDFKFDKITRAADAIALIVSGFSSLSKQFDEHPKASSRLQRRFFTAWNSLPGNH